MSDMGRAMLRHRKRAGLTQYRVALALGVGQSTVAMWEAGVNMPRSSMLPKIAKVYGCSIQDLYGDKHRKAGID